MSKVSDSAYRVIDFETAPTFLSVGGGPGASLDTVTFWEGASSASRKVTSSTLAGYTAIYISPTSTTYPPWDSSYSPSLGPSINRLNSYSSPGIVGTLISNTQVKSPIPKREFLMIKFLLTDASDLAPPTTTTQPLGIQIRQRASTDMNTRVARGDDDITPDIFVPIYPPNKSWLVFAGEATCVAGQRVVSMPFWHSIGYSATMLSTAGQVTGVGILAAVSTGVAKSENLFIDALDHSSGLYITGGTASPDNPAVFADLVVYDTGDINNRFGHALEEEGIIFFRGGITIGRNGKSASPSEATEPTYFYSRNEVVVFPESATAPEFNRIDVDLSDPGTAVTFEGCILQGTIQGSGNFELTNAVVTSPAGNNDLFYVPSHIRMTERVWVDPEAPFPVSPEFMPQSPATAVYQYKKTADNLIPTMVYLLAKWPKTNDDSTRGFLVPVVRDHHYISQTINTTRSSSVNVFATSPIISHEVEVYSDPRPILSVQAPASPGGTFDIIGGAYINFRAWGLCPEAVVTDATIIGISRVYQNGATLTGCTFTGSIIKKLSEDGIVYSDDPELITNCVFEYNASARCNDGHAIVLTTPGTYTFQGNTFPGAWGATGSATAHILNASGGTVTLNVVDGDTPTYTNATNSPENVTVINQNVNVTLTNIRPNTEIRVYPAQDFNSPISTTEIDGIENTGSPTEFTFTTAAGNIVDIVVLNIDYVLPPDNRIRNFVVPTTSTSFPVSQILDRNYSNP